MDFSIADTAFLKPIYSVLNFTMAALMILPEISTGSLDDRIMLLRMGNSPVINGLVKSSSFERLRYFLICASTLYNIILRI